MSLKFAQKRLDHLIDEENIPEDGAKGLYSSQYVPYLDKNYLFFLIGQTFNYQY